MSIDNTIFSNRDRDESLIIYPTAEALDAYFSSISCGIESSEICNAINRIFGIDIDLAPVLHPDYAFLDSRTAIDSYLKKHGNKQGGPEIRQIIQQLFGMNLAGIAELYKDRIDLYSKDQWMVQNDLALFLVHTGKKDIDVRIIPTDYFIKKTGMEVVPPSLQEALAPLGYSYIESEQHLYYKDPDGQPVSGEFKIKTMKAIAKIVHADFVGF
ncbi:hypothetical protein B0H99_10115 [Planomicrobium soli]|uniref:Uncharacterized protein n=1 Tax=Planomicrobium soli TaxID=1176648 RepID=A0A2P8H6B9_9BACL|nr:hypothetical protein [Planomicrobium soli]PSL41772.1 hypothetical protein B0H99_10115 [Planomicrobium soli]